MTFANRYMCSALLTFLVFLSSVVMADGVAVSNSSVHDRSTVVSNPEIPTCLDIQLAKKEHLGSSRTKDLSDDELLTRLIYSETRAAKCPGEESRIFPGIASVILNRVKEFEKKDSANAVRRVVFGKDQFASSLKSYSASNWEEFTCPTAHEFDAELYAKIRVRYDMLKNGSVQNPYPDSTHYYLHQHFGKFKKQPWGKGAKLLSSLGMRDKEICLGVYRETKSYLKAPLVE